MLLVVARIAVVISIVAAIKFLMLLGMMEIVAARLTLLVQSKLMNWNFMI